MKYMNRHNCRLLRADISTALAQVCEEHGVEVELGNMTFTEKSLSTKLKVRVAGAETDEARWFKQRAYNFGLKPADLGRSFTMAARRYRITGSKRTALKRPIIAESPCGKKISIGPKYLKALLEAS